MRRALPLMARARAHCVVKALSDEYLSIYICMFIEQSHSNRFPYYGNANGESPPLLLKTLRTP